MKNIIILAGGAASRMKNSLSIDRDKYGDLIDKPKSMIPVGEEKRPFLDYLLLNISRAGYSHAVIVTGENDNSIKEHYSGKYNSSYNGLTLEYIMQPVPAGRTKPLGTSDALMRVLDAHKEWSGTKFTICNGDNLYSVKALLLLAESEEDNAMIDYDKDSLGLHEKKINKFAIILKDSSSYLTDILEKPTDEEIRSVIKRYGRIGISMNLWLFTFDQVYGYLKETPLHPVREEKELPLTVKLMLQDNKFRIYAYPLNEEVADLSSAGDIVEVERYVNRNG